MAGAIDMDKKLSRDVRRKTLEAIGKVLDGKDSQYRRALILKLAGTVLPRLNEHTGEGGEPISLTWKSSSPTNPEPGPKPSTPQ
jgi:hypothetical protein